MNKHPFRLIVGITGATGTILGVRLLQVLREAKVETHLVLSNWGARTLIHETSYTVQQVQQMAAQHYAPQDQGAAVSSGSFVTQGMVICPCSVRSLAAIAQGHGDTLVHRAADVGAQRTPQTSAGRPRNAVERHSPRNMLKLSRMGVVIFPPVPAFYNHPKTIDDLVDQTVLRILDQFGLNLTSSHRWGGAPWRPVKRSLLAFLNEGK